MNFENPPQGDDKETKRTESPRKEDRMEQLGHLKEGVRPIYACVGTYSDYEEQTGLVEEEVDSNTEGVGEDLDVISYEDEEYNKERGVLGKRRTYAISEINEKLKLSEGYQDCTALIVVGTEKETGKEISILTHQSSRVPDEFKDDFENDLLFRLAEMRLRCEPGTIDAVITGGNYIGPDTPDEEGLLERKNVSDSTMKHYVASIKFLSSLVKERLGFEPYVISGPKTKPLGSPVVGSRDNIDSIYFDTQNRRVYLLRPESTRMGSNKDAKGDKGNLGFYPRDVESKERDWK